MWGPDGEIRLSSALEILVERPPPRTPHNGLSLGVAPHAHPVLNTSVLNASVPLESNPKAKTPPMSPHRTRSSQSSLGPVASPKQVEETPVSSPILDSFGTIPLFAQMPNPLPEGSSDMPAFSDFLRELQNALMR